MAATPRRVVVHDLGRTRYGEALALQRRLQEERAAGAGMDVLLLTEHEPVFTLGRNHPEPDLRGPLAAIEAAGIAIVQTERGGDITYHGPGQLVAYGIIDSRAWRLPVVDYVAGLEETVIRLLRRWTIEGRRVAGARGVWVEERKIASVGVNVRRGVTMHGIALNVACDLSAFGLINPCGMTDVEMTSVERESGAAAGMDAASRAFLEEFAAVFACDVRLAAAGMPLS
jgi:lipoate-protein ligase B